MPHYSKPFFKPKRNTWYVQVGPTWFTLGKNPDGLPAPKKRGAEWDAPREILDAYHAKMADLQADIPAAPDAAPAVATVLDEFIGWLQGRVAEGSKAPKTLSWYNVFGGSSKQMHRNAAAHDVGSPSLGLPNESVLSIR